MRILFGNFGERELVLSPPPKPQPNPYSINAVLKQVQALILKCEARGARVKDPDIRAREIEETHGLPREQQEHYEVNKRHYDIDQRTMRAIRVYIGQLNDVIADLQDKMAHGFQTLDKKEYEKVGKLQKEVGAFVDQKSGESY